MKNLNNIKETNIDFSKKKPSNEKNLCFKSIFLGMLISVALSFLLNLLNIGLGLSAYHYQNSTATFSVGGFIWLLIAGFGLMFLTGFITSRVSLTSSGWYGILHGFAAWCLGIIFVLMISIWTINLAKDININIIISQPLVSLLASSMQHDINPKDLQAAATGVLAMFFIFLAGGIGSCLGGYLAVRK